VICVSPSRCTGDEPARACAKSALRHVALTPSQCDALRHVVLRTSGNKTNVWTFSGARSVGGSGPISGRTPSAAAGTTSASSVRVAPQNLPKPGWLVRHRRQSFHEPCSQPTPSRIRHGAGTNSHLPSQGALTIYLKRTAQARRPVIQWLVLPPGQNSLAKERVHLSRADGAAACAGR
jgi:hypothetical protein